MRARLRKTCLLVLALYAGATAHAEPPATTAPGQLNVWSNEAMRPLVQRWADGFRQRHPEIRIVTNFQGSDVAVAGLYTKRADIALLGREPTASELQAFEWIYRYRPTRVELMTGGMAGAGKSAALLVSVHRDNPLASLTLAQVDAIFGNEGLRGLQQITNWGQLGLKGKWQHRPIRLYGYDAYSGSGRYFRHAVLKDSRKLDWDRLTEFADARGADGQPRDAGRRILDALATDPFGMAVSIAAPDDKRSKALALAADGAAPIAASKATLVSRSYPLVRTPIALLRRAPGKPADPAAAAFLRYVLGSEGQAEVAGEGSYLPLTPEQASVQLRQVD